MNGPDALAAARNAGASFRLAEDGHAVATGLDRLPPALAAAVRAQGQWIADALCAEAVDSSPLPWVRHGPGWLAVVDDHRLLVGSTGTSWWATHRPPGQAPTVIVARGTLPAVLARLERELGAVRPEAVAS